MLGHKKRLMVKSFAKLANPHLEAYLQFYRHSEVLA